MNEEELKQLREILEFGKFGFRGTLASGFGGIFLVLSLALLDAFTQFSISGVELIWISAIFLVGTVSFGYFSLRKLPDITLDLKRGSLAVASKNTPDQ